MDKTTKANAMRISMVASATKGSQLLDIAAVTEPSGDVPARTGCVWHPPELKGRREAVDGQNRKNDNEAVVQCGRKPQERGEKEDSRTKQDQPRRGGTPCEKA